MAQEVEQIIKQFKGIRNDEDPKQIGFDEFASVVNWNFPDDGTLGMTKIPMPKQVVQFDDANVDGIFEYRYLDPSNVLQTENIIVNNGKVWKTNLTNTNTALKTGLTSSKVSMVAYQDKLFIANGKNYVNVYEGALGVVHEMGAPAAIDTGTAGNVNVGAHYYAVTYTTAAGEEVLGSVSNTVTIASSAKQIGLHLPIGYDGTLARNIYRTAAGGTQLKLLATISDNTTLLYTDNIADASLTTNIPAVAGQELPKPYHLIVANFALYGAVVDRYPTQIFKTDEGIELFDVSQFIDVANQSSDNTPVKGIGFDFSNVIVGTEKNMYFVTPSTTTVGVTAVIPSRSYVGIKDGHTMRYLPSHGDFAGGLIFVSALNDVRIMNGLDALPVSTSVNNVRTENWAQNIRGVLNYALRSYNNIYAEFYENKYHLQLDYTTFIFDIRTQGWTTKQVVTASYTSHPIVMGILGGKLYNGQADGWIEQEYYGVQYRSEDVPSTIISGIIDAKRDFKMLTKLVVWYKSDTISTVNVSVVCDDNTYYPISGSFTTTSVDYSFDDFDPNDYNSLSNPMQYKVVNIPQFARWCQWSLSCSTGNVSLQGIGLCGIPVSNKEG